MSVAVECSQCGRAIHSTALSGVCASCLVNTTRSGLGTGHHAAPGEALWSGRTVGPQDRFMLLKKIGQGGMGEIWLANDEHLSRGKEARPVALKFLSEEIRTNERAMELLRDEVARTQTLNHPNIVRIHDMHATMDGTPFIKMEYVEGDSLAQWLRSSGEPMPWRMVCELGAQVALALDYAHRTANLVHRDVKPGNILVGKGPTAKLTDFGIAQVCQEMDEGVESEPMGTMAYSSPEQVQGRPPSPADDVYALGATFFELLTGSTPSEASTTEALKAHTIYTVPENVNERLKRSGRADRVPSDLANLVAQCLQKHPAHRPSMKRVAALLGQLTGLTEEFAPKLERKSWWQTAALAACLVIGAYGAFKYDWLKAIQAKIQPAPKSETSDRPAAPASVQEPTGNTAAEVAEPPIRAPESPAVVPPAPAVEPGWIVVTVSAGLDAQRKLQVWHKDKLVVPERPLPQQTLYRFYYESREPGPHRVVVTQDKYQSSAERTIPLEPGKTNATVIYFGTRDISLRSDPISDVSWMHESSAKSAMADGGTRKFYAEVPYKFVFRKDGYRTLVVTNTFQGYGKGSLEVALEPKTAPEFGRGAAPLWTNGMGMVFRLVGDLRVGTTETTVAQFRRFVEATGSHHITNGMFSITVNGRRQAGYSWQNPGFAQTDGHPVVGVSEGDARAFCDWLTQADEGQLDPGQVYRLPTVAEWRAFSGAGRFPWGNDSKISGNFSGVEVLAGAGEFRWPTTFPLIEDYEDGWIRTAPVAADPAFARAGLAFIAGNAAEWCQDGKVCGGSWFDGETLDLYDTMNTLLTDELIQPAPAGERDDRYGFRVVVAEGRVKR